MITEWLLHFHTQQDADDAVTRLSRSSREAWIVEMSKATGCPKLQAVPRSGAFPHVFLDYEQWMLQTAAERPI
jgi:hypothetical protein